MQQGWTPVNFVTCEAGASSAFDAELIPDNQLAWLRNGRIRGGKQHTRPFFRQRMVLPRGLVQGGSYFSVQGGMFVMQIDGRIYRLRIGNRDSDFSYEEIPLGFINSPVLPTAWMVETVGSLVIQDGQSNPIIYDGSTARRSDLAKNEVPLGRMMAYGNGRLWVAIGANELVAGDIVTKEFQSELKFTETGYFFGGGKFLFPTAITGLKFVPASGSAGYGSLAVFTQEQTYLIKADITSRDLWAQIPGFIQPLLLSTGAIGQYGIAEVNQDLYWRDADGGIRSIRSAIADETGGPGLTPMSREVSRITDFESVHRLVNTSAINFGNRLLCTASPFINRYGKTSFRDLISLDFSPVSSMRGKSAPSYDGEWDGLLFDLLLTGKFGGTKRGFVVSTDYDGNNRLWEIVDTVGSVTDTFYGCMGTAQLFESPPPVIAEYPTRDWGNPAERKRLQRCDVYLSDIEGDAELEVYYRPDNYQKWTKWGDTIPVCANTSDPGGTTPHVWKNLQGQERPQVKTLTIDDEINNLTNYAKQVGFMFQIRTVLRGKAKIHQVTVWAQAINQTQFADRELDDALCKDNDVTGNEINYLITPGCTMPMGTALCGLTYSMSPVFDGEWSLFSYPEGVNPLDVSIVTEGGSDNATVSVPEFGTYVFRLTSASRTLDYEVFFSVSDTCCITVDPLPYTIPFDALLNPESYSGSQQYGLMPVEELREFINTPDNASGLANWTICPYADFCDGPEVEGEVQDSIYETRWFVNAESAPVQYGVDGVSSNDVPDDLFVGVDQSAIFAASIAFDSNALPTFAIQTESGTIEIRRYVAGAPTTYSFSGDFPRMLYDGILQRDASSLDIVCFYVRSGTVWMRFQRDNFGIEYSFVSATPEAYRVTKTDKQWPYQILYFTDTSGKYLAARSEAYPPFPIVVEDLGTSSADPAGGEYLLGIVDAGVYNDAGSTMALPSGGEYESSTVTIGPYTDAGTASAQASGGEYSVVVVMGGNYADSALNASQPESGSYDLISTNGGTYTESATTSASPSGGEYS